MHLVKAKRRRYPQFQFRFGKPYRNALWRRLDVACASTANVSERVFVCTKADHCEHQQTKDFAADGSVRSRLVTLPIAISL